MDILAQKRQRNYSPHSPETRLHACKRVRESGWTAKRACSYYHVSRASLWRWLKAFDGTEESLADRSHRPHSPHPRTTSKKAAYKVACYRKRNPGDSSVDIWAKTRKSGFPISYSTCLRILKKLDGYEAYKTNPKKHDGVYHTPEFPGDKWQIDVKYVPKECKAPGLEGRFYQYTYLDEASRKRYLHFAAEHSMYETVVGLAEAIAFFGYQPTLIQTDNGTEFSDRAITKGGGEAAGRGGRPNALEAFCAARGIEHKFIRPRTPEHNGKVERSHRIDQEKFYRNLRFFSLQDLAAQGARWMRKYNDTPRMVLKMKSPNEAELEKLSKLKDDTGEVRCQKLLKRFTSIAN